MDLKLNKKIILLFIFNKMINLTKTIYVEPKFLNKNVRENILQVLKDNVNEDCTKDYGYILNIKNYKIIKSEQDIYTLEFEARTLKPEKDKEYTCKVCMITKDGIFGVIDDKQKILIPSSKMKEYKYNDIKNNFTNMESEINIDNMLDVKVTDVMYSDKRLSCIGILLFKKIK